MRLITIFILGNAQLPGNSLKLIADGQYVEVPDASSNSLDSNMTIEMWVYYTCENGASKTCLITKGWCSTTWSYYFSINSQKLDFLKQVTDCVSNAYTYYSTNDPVINYNTWTHVAVVIADTSVMFFVNGQSVNSALTAGEPLKGFKLSTEPIRIGSYKANGGTQLLTPKGNLDDIRIWHTARTQTQIANNYNKELSGNESGLFCYWKLNETGSGPGINVVNSASATGTAFAGTTVGNVSFADTNSVFPCVPAANIVNKSTLEGNTSTKLLKFPVILSNSYTDKVKVKYKTHNNTAKDNSDYVQTTGTLVFKPGQTSKTINVTVNGDTKTEQDETFYVVLSNPENATIANDTAIGTIRNDDGSFESKANNYINPVTTGGLVAYPNPVKTILYIQAKGSAVFILTNSTGKVILTKKINSKGSIDVSKLPAGLYFLKNNETVEIQKIVVEK